jgi:hypothetical protein
MVTIYWQGARIGRDRKYLPTLFITAVNAAKPHKYKYRVSTEHTVSPAFAALTAMWERLRHEPTDERPARQALPKLVDDDRDVLEAEILPLSPSTPADDAADAATFALLDRLNGFATDE